MRRSRTIRLTLLAASAIALQACGEDVDSVDVVVTDLAACVERFGADAQADCEKSMSEAQTQHALTAPRFASVEACREATGSECQVTAAVLPSDKAMLGSAVAGIAIPVLAGVMIGRMMDNGAGRMTTPLYAGRPPGECGPGMSPASNCTTTRSGSGGSSGSRFFYAGSTYAGSAPARGGAVAFTPSPAMAATISAPRAGGATSISRGGFGASARGYSSSS